MDPKKLEIEVVKILSLFLVGCFVIIVQPKLFSSSSNFFANIA
jgi:hypothetical protein